jgi:alpha-L-fucosidase 2
MELDGKAREYSRSLDIGNAVSDVSFKVDGIEYRREVFVSAPDEIMAVRISCENPAMVSLSCSVDGRDDYYDDNRPCGKNMIMYTGGTGSRDGIFFAAVIGAAAKGGSIRTLGNKISVKNADEVMIVLSVRTSFYTDNYEESAQVDAEMAMQCEWDELYYRHVSDYKELFERVELNLEDNSEANIYSMTTDERITRLRGDEMDSKDCARLIHDNKLIELYFNFGRYLMISASRPSTQPMNLQGIWNEHMWPAWGSRYTININTEMNYWCA